MNTFNFPKHLRGKQDGSLVSHALDYYIPEWTHITGYDIILARGSSGDGAKFIIKIDANRMGVARITKLDDMTSSILIDMLQPKKSLLSLSREGDSHHKSIDKRYLMMLDDLRHQK